MRAANRKASPYEVNSVKKALEILRAFATGPPECSVSQLSRDLELPKSTTHNLLRTLCGFDFLTQDQDSKLFRLGPRIFELGLRASQQLNLESLARPHLRELRDLTHETARLAVPSGGQALIVAAEESESELHTRGDAGRRTHPHCTALGKALLAGLPEEEFRAEAARHPLPRMTPNTITTVERLEREIRIIRHAGFALDWDENEEGVRSAAAAIRGSHGRVVAAISVSGPSQRLTETRLRDAARRVLQHADAITRELAAHTRK